MPLPAALQARLAKRGLIKDDEPGKRIIYIENKRFDKVSCTMCDM